MSIYQTMNWTKATGKYSKGNEPWTKQKEQNGNMQPVIMAGSGPAQVPSTKGEERLSPGECLYPCKLLGYWTPSPNSNDPLGWIKPSERSTHGKPRNNP